MKIFLFDMGVPMIFPTMYLMIAALLPIVFLEGYVLAQKLGIEFRKTMLWTSLANLISTIIGIPVTWFGLFLVQLITGGDSTYQVGPLLDRLLSVTVQAPWLLPIDRDESWMLVAAELFLLIPFFFASWAIEYLVMRNALAASVSLVRENQISMAESTADTDQTTTESSELEVRRGVRNANLLSYGLLALLLLAMLLNSLLNAS
jgi:hypothetical protein